MSENITAVRIQHDSESEPIVHLSDGSSIALSELIEQAAKWRRAKSPGAVDRAMNRAEHADQLRVRAERAAAEASSMWRSAANRAGLWERKAGKIIEQAGAWKRRTLAAESDLELAREQARYREGELVRSGHQQLLEAQSKALDTIQRIAAQLPVDPIIDAEVVVPDVEVDTWFGEDDTPVVQIDTHRGHGRLRINLNDGVVWDGDPETDERPGKNAELIEWEQRALAQAETISRQLDTIRDQAEKIEELVQALKNRNGEGDPADPGAHGGAIPRYGMLDVWQAIQRSADIRAFDAFYDHHGYAEAWATLLAELRKLRDDLDRRERLSDDDARAVRALQARKVELEAEVLAERGALAVCQTKLTDTKAELAESQRAFDAIDSRNRELAEKVAQLEEQRAECAANLSRESARRADAERGQSAAWRDLDQARAIAGENGEALAAVQAESERKLSEVTQHCNEQLATLSTKLTGQEERATIAAQRADELLLKLDQSERLSASRAEQIETLNGQIVAHGEAAHLRDVEVHKLARLWETMSDSWRTNVGHVINRQLMRVFADHGVDTERLPAFAKSEPCPPPHQLVTEHAQLALAASRVIRDANNAYVSSPALMKALGKLKGALDHAGKTGQVDARPALAAEFEQRAAASTDPEDAAAELDAADRITATSPEAWGELLDEIQSQLATGRPVTDRIIREFNHLRAAAERVSEFSGRTPGVYPFKLRSLIADLRDALQNGAPDPTPDRADCA